MPGVTGLGRGGFMLVDSHTHLLRLEVSPEEAVREAAEAGVGAVINVGTDVEDSKRGAELAAVLPNVYSTAGIHPHNAGSYTAADLEALAELCESPGIVALGEVGLDYYRGYATPDRKSTRLNSSHANISYAAFCLKKKKKSARPCRTE